ncbi:hypothetical protein X975_21316, partial [Stegodyphus mimosarum]
MFTKFYPCTHLGLPTNFFIEIPTLKGSVPQRVKEKGEIHKVYIALFICAVTRAVHNEVISDIPGKSLNFSLRRFIASRETCKEIYSDNAENFCSTYEVIKGSKRG